MIFDANLVFWGTAPYGSASNFTSLVGVTGSGSASNTINLQVAEDMGIGDGEAVPKLAIYIGTGITSASNSATYNLQFQGSTDSSNWTTYAESGALTSASFAAGQVFPIDVPKRPQGAALPQYYRLNLAMAANGTASISTGTILAGIVIQRADSEDTLGKYSSGFTVV
jgi:hypothetical protein